MPPGRYVNASWEHTRGAEPAACPGHRPSILPYLSRATYVTSSCRHRVGEGFQLENRGAWSPFGAAALRQLRRHAPPKPHMHPACTLSIPAHHLPPRPTWSEGVMGPPGAQEQAEMAPVVALAAASNTGTRPVAISTGACPLPLSSMGSTRKTGRGEAAGQQGGKCGAIEERRRGPACMGAGPGQGWTRWAGHRAAPRIKPRATSLNQPPSHLRR